MALGAVQFHAVDEEAVDDGFVPIAAFLLRMRQFGIMDRRMVDAFESVPREQFMSSDGRRAPLFAERPQPIDCGQLNTPPIVAARMIEALAPTTRCRVFEIGTGTGYLTAVLSRLSRRVYTIDRFRTLVAAAQNRFEMLRIGNISSSFGDGLIGWPDKGPFDRIICSASAPAVPQAFIESLTTSGTLVMPIGPDDGIQTMTRFMRVDRQLVATPICPVRMVPLIRGRAAAL
ncbi:protein-L-isoaspartate(D-aspartate) O-methyltransferase [Kaistia adipata]|uniref:protein-L-isoaspartate(D-aspartate) O-methyltransferase n=1 Tax=Kaistia adipata TaxID=166954 RepID=UPI000A041BC3|nr:protein-L-isoaspartate(D-aspartate) O-methyltransferase [Kaistia adipata]